MYPSACSFRSCGQYALIRGPSPCNQSPSLRCAGSCANEDEIHCALLDAVYQLTPRSLIHCEEERGVNDETQNTGQHQEMNGLSQCTLSQNLYPRFFNSALPVVRSSFVRSNMQYALHIVRLQSVAQQGSCNVHVSKSKPPQSLSPPVPWRDGTSHGYLTIITRTWYSA